MLNDQIQEVYSDIEIKKHSLFMGHPNETFDDDLSDNIPDEEHDDKVTVAETRVTTMQAARNKVTADLRHRIHQLYN